MFTLFLIGCIALGALSFPNKPYPPVVNYFQKALAFLVIIGALLLLFGHSIFHF